MVLRLLKVFVCIFAILGLVALCTGVSVVQGVRHAVSDQFILPEGQKVLEVNATGASFSTKLQTDRAIVLEGVEACSGQSLVDDSLASYSSICVNGGCETKLNFYDHSIPDTLTVHHMVNGACVRRVIANPAQYLKVTGYKGTIVIDEVLSKALQLPADAGLDFVKTPKSRYTGIGGTGTMHNKRIDLEYQSAPTEDEVVLQSKLLKVKYTPDH